MERPQLVIHCPCCAFAAAHKADTEREAALWLGHVLAEHMADVHPTVTSCDVHVDVARS